MVQIAGKYEIVSSENFKELLVKRGFPEDTAKAASEAKTTLEVIVDGNKIKFVADQSLQNYTTEIVLDGEFEEKLPSGTIIKSVAKQNNNVIVVESKTTDGKSTGKRTHTFTDGGLETVYVNADNFTAKRIYKRL